MKHIVTFLLLGVWVLFAQDGRVPVTFENYTLGDYSDDEIFIYGLGLDASSQWCRYSPAGDLIPLDPADVDGPGHISKNGRNFANYSFTLSEAQNFRMNTWVGGGRFYISLGSPMYIPISAGGWGGPNPDDPADPNADVIWDLYEFTYKYLEVPYGGNISKVDQFGLPMTVRMQQEETGYDEIVGVPLSRDQVFSMYAASVGPEFQELANDYRIVAPRSAGIFKAGGKYENYLQAHIDEVWTYYAQNPFQLTRLGQTYMGQVTGDQLIFSGQGSGTLNKPTTIDIFACAGAFASPGMSTDELQMGAEFSAAFNRGVALNTAKWWAGASEYYGSPWQNDYAEFFHSISIDNRAYAFAYDDINDQSSVKILGNSNPPSSITITLYPHHQDVPLGREVTSRMALGVHRPGLRISGNSVLVLDVSKDSEGGGPSFNLKGGMIADAVKRRD